MAKRTTQRKSKPARPVKAKPAKVRKAKAAKPRPARKPAPKPKAVARKARPAGPRAKKPVPKGRAARRAAVPTEKRSRAMEKLMAMKTAKPEAPPRKEKEGFLIKAPKKARAENLMAAPRFVRRLAPPLKSVAAPLPAKPVVPPKKIVIRKRDLDELRRALSEERQRLIAQLAALDETASLTGPSEVNENIPGYSIHLAEYASENQVVETTLAQRTLQAERLAEIETALQRVGQPGYGICRNCSNAISMERLKAKPSAELCVPCRKLKEQGRL